MQSCRIPARGGERFFMARPFVLRWDCMVLMMTPSPGAGLRRHGENIDCGGPKIKPVLKLFGNFCRTSFISKGSKTTPENDSSAARLQILPTGGILYRKQPQGYLYSFDRMDFQQTGKQDNAGRFERGYLKVTTDNLTNWDLPGCKKPPKTNE